MSHHVGEVWEWVPNGELYLVIDTLFIRYREYYELLDLQTGELEQLVAWALGGEPKWQKVQ